VRDAVRLGCALAVGLAIAFPAGMMFAGRQRAAAPAPAGSAERRQAYSPVIRRDPYFVAQQRQNLVLLERQCRATGDLCHEARQVRAWLEREGLGD
jgi:hypothetical protein